MRARVDEVIAERTRVFDAITDIGLPVVESDANFLWLPIPEHAAVLGEYSERAGRGVAAVPRRRRACHHRHGRRTTVC